MTEEVSVASPVIEAAPAVVEAPVVAEAPIVETVKSEAAPIVSEEAKQPLLSPEVVDEAKPVDEVKPVEEVKPIDEALPLPTYEFKLPEGVQTDSEQYKAFTSKLGELQNLSKAEQAVVQKFGQEMIEMHVNEMKTIAEKSNRDAWDWFNNRNKEWLETSKKDPSIGGDNFGETVSSAQKAISLYGGTKAQQIETAKLFQETGVENHPALLRFLANITTTAAKEGTPVSAQNAPIQKFSPSQALYGGSSKAS